MRKYLITFREKQMKGDKDKKTKSRKAKYPARDDLLLEIRKRQLGYSFLARMIGTTRMQVFAALNGYLISKPLCRKLEAFLRDYDRLMGNSSPSTEEGHKI